MEELLLNTQNVTKFYGSDDATVHALAGVDLSVRRGEFVAIMGPSGSGKSTLMNILGCLDRPTSGAYVLDGEDVSELSRAQLADVRNRKIGFIFQSFNLLPRLSALKNVMMPMLYYRQDADERPRVDEREERATRALEDVGLGDRLHHRPNQLSGGQQQRVAIARALVNQPPLILADEPTGNLDSHASEEVMTLIGGLHRKGVTILMVTHDPTIAAHAERVVCLRDGLIVADGPGGGGNCVEREGRR